jgi:two-component system OmpR family sensor kinase
MLALAGNAVRDARVLDPSRPITLEVGQSDPPPIVIGDEIRLQQVVANLVGNALRHTPPATPVMVRVSSRVDQHVGRGTVVLAVADEGPGMTPDEAARVFERFYRADQSRSRNGGTGLGLAIVAALVAGHGGTVDVETSPGAGCCFRVEIPLAAVPAAPVPAASS